ncbi:hypothetical protein ACHAWF_007612 [Thalassiosira exigua]
MPSAAIALARRAGLGTTQSSVLPSFTRPCYTCRRPKPDQLIWHNRSHQSSCRYPRASLCSHVSRDTSSCDITGQRWGQMQGATRYSGVFHFSSSSKSAVQSSLSPYRNLARPEKNETSNINGHSHVSLPARSIEIEENEEYAHLTKNENDTQTTPPTQQIKGVSGSQNKTNILNGYKYRILRTSPPTNDLITLPEPPAERTPLSTPLSETSSQTVEKENDDMNQIQVGYDSGRVESQHDVSTGIKDILSSRWWHTLYQNIVNKQTTTTAPRPSPQTYQSSLRIRRSSLLLEEIVNNDSYTGFLPDERQHQEDEGNISERITVRSVQVASSIDVMAALSKVFGGGVARASQYKTLDGKSHPLSEFFTSSPPIRHVFGKTNIILQLMPPSKGCPPSLSHSVPRYVAIYRFGSVVFFNVTTKEASLLSEQIKKHSTEPIASGFERREHFEVALQPQLESVSGKITADRAVVRELDMNTVGLVSNIMGQTVALDWHNDTVDELLANFSRVNSSVERTGGFTNVERHTLFQVVARNNSLFIDMVGKLGIKDRSDTAWHLSQYEGLHEGMRKEFDLDERFRDIEFKLDLIQQNAKFFLEVLHAQKSNTLEWVIIVLISFECVLMIMDMSGWGTQMLSGWSFF